MDLLTPISADAIFSAANDQATQMETLSNQALVNGIDKYTKQDYKGAAQEFRRAFNLSPYSDYSVQAAKYLSMSYQKLGQTDKAIEIYEQAVKLHPDNDELQSDLGNLYFGEGRTGDAIAAYETAVRIFDDANNRFSLGQGYLKAGRFGDAENQFNKVIRINPQSADGYFGLGQTYSAEKKYPEAIKEFERAIQKKRDFYAAYAEMGYTYADAGELDKAREMRDFLDLKDPSSSETLKAYINKMTHPRILTAWATSSFQFYLPPKTEVAALSDYLANANASQTFTMQFQFDKAMDRESVEDPLNWAIKRASGHGPGTDYNNGLAIPDTEVRIAPIPTSVYYDDKYFTATVRFTISQNADADGTIDPTHLEFSFKGIDADGNAMNPKYDQFMGFTGHI